MIDTLMLEKLKRRLGIAETDTEEDKLLQDIISDAISHFMLITKSDIVDAKYNFIILDVADMRYNRKGSTGMKSESVDGYSVTWQDAKEDFAPYWNLLKDDFDLEDNSGDREKGNMVAW